MNFNKGDFIKWKSGEDELVGRFLNVANKMVRFEISANGSVAEIPENDGKFTATSQPKDWKKTTSAPKIEPTKAPKVKTATSIRKPKEKKAGGTKVDLVVALLKNHPNVSRKEAIELIVKAGISTPAGASTFYSMAKKVM